MIICLATASSCAAQTEPSLLFQLRSRLSAVSISPETTFIESPLTEDGLPNYSAWLSPEEPAEAASDQNAAVDLLALMTPFKYPGNVSYAQRVARRLGLEAVPDHLPRFDPDGEGLQSEVQKQQAREFFVRPWKPADCPELAEWLRDRDPALRRLEQILERPFLYLPTVPFDRIRLRGPSLHNQDDSLPHWARDIWRALSQRAMRSLGEGHADRAIDDVERILRLVGWLGADDRLDRWADAGHGSQIAMYTAIAVAIHPETTSEQLDRLAGVIAAHPFFHPAQRLIDRWGRAESLDAVCLSSLFGPANLDEIETASYSEDRLTSLAFLLADWDEVLRETNRIYDDLVNVAGFDSASRRLAAADEICERFRQRSNITLEVPWRHDGWINLPRLPGQVAPALCRPGLVCQLPLALELVQQFANARQQMTRYVTELHLLATTGGLTRLVFLREAQRLAMIRLTTMCVAAKRYQVQTGQLPQTPDQLVPDWLQEIPVDPWDGSPVSMRHDDEALILSVVGWDGFEYGYGEDKDGSVIGGVVRVHKSGEVEIRLPH